MTDFNDDKDIYVCIRVSDLLIPRPESVRGACDDCGAAVWMMPDAPFTMPRVCLQCAGPRAAAAVADGDQLCFMPGAAARTRKH